MGQIPSILNIDKVDSVCLTSGIGSLCKMMTGMTIRAVVAMPVTSLPDEELPVLVVTNIGNNKRLMKLNKTLLTVPNLSRRTLAVRYVL